MGSVRMPETKEEAVTLYRILYKMLGNNHI